MFDVPLLVVRYYSENPGFSMNQTHKRIVDDYYSDITLNGVGQIRCIAGMSCLRFDQIELAKWLSKLDH